MSYFIFKSALIILVVEQFLVLQYIIVISIYANEELGVGYIAHGRPRLIESTIDLRVFWLGNF